MKATKFTVTFTVEVLSVDVVPGIMSTALDLFKNEFRAGSITADDGDTVRWDVEQKEVVI